MSAGYTFKSEEDFKRAVRAIRAYEREAFPAIRPKQHLYSPLGDTLPTVPCVNGSGLVIPAYGLVKRTGVSGGNVTCVRPDGNWGFYLVNANSSEVAVGATFRGYCAGQVTVAAAGGGTGTDVGPVANSFLGKIGVPLIHFYLSVGSTLTGDFAPPQVLVGKPLANIGAGSSGSLVLYDNTLAAISPQMVVSVRAMATLGTTKFASAVYNSGIWLAMPMEC